MTERYAVLAHSVVLVFLLWPNILYTCRPVYLVYVSIIKDYSTLNLTCAIHLTPMKVGVFLRFMIKLKQKSYTANVIVREHQLKDALLLLIL